MWLFHGELVEIRTPAYDSFRSFFPRKIGFVIPIRMQESSKVRRTFEAGLPYPPQECPPAADVNRIVNFPKHTAWCCPNNVAACRNVRTCAYLRVRSFQNDTASGRRCSLMLSLQTEGVGLSGINSNRRCTVLRLSYYNYWNAVIVDARQLDPKPTSKRSARRWKFPVDSRK